MDQSGYGKFANGGGGWSGKRFHNGGSSNDTPKKPRGQYGYSQSKGTKLAMEKGGDPTEERSQKVKPYAKFAIDEKSDVRVGYFNGEKCIRISNGIDIYTNRKPITQFCTNDISMEENITSSGSSNSNSGSSVNKTGKSSGSDTVFLTIANFEKLLEVISEIQTAALTGVEKEIFLG